MNRKAEVLSRAIVRDLVEVYEANVSDIVLISIETPDRVYREDDLHREKWKDSLVVQFHDIDREEDGLTAINTDHAQEIVDFILKHNGEEFIIHCDAGISRSAAVGLFMESRLDYDVHFNMGPGLANNRVRKALEEYYFLMQDEEN